MSSPAQQMHSYYAARAAEYDAVYLKPERQADLRAIEAWLPTRFGEGAAVLEVACGTGYWTQFIAPKASRMLALDAAPETLAIARNRLAGEQAVEFVVSDAYALPKRGGSVFDAAFAGFWFSHVPKGRRREFLAGLAEAVEPGARIVLIDNRFVEGSSTPLSEHDAEGNTYQLRTLNDGSRHRVLKNFPSRAELEGAIEGLGSSPVFTEWQYFWAFEYLAAGPSQG
ncbi:class I SAM-dependent methyltransferase [Paucibacter soli]|uniref:class I SAM-dependent methyltransferase n=1 Tax=Paucibacter soli TaxID=3133433 RepID=UPI0030B2C9B3